MLVAAAAGFQPAVNIIQPKYYHTSEVAVLKPKSFRTQYNNVRTSLVNLIQRKGSKTSYEEAHCEIHDVTITQNRTVNIIIVLDRKTVYGYILDPTL